MILYINEYFLINKTMLSIIIYESLLFLLSLYINSHKSKRNTLYSYMFIYYLLMKRLINLLSTTKRQLNIYKLNSRFFSEEINAADLGFREVSELDMDKKASQSNIENVNKMIDPEFLRKKYQRREEVSERRYERIRKEKERRDNHILDVHLRYIEDLYKEKIMKIGSTIGKSSDEEKKVLYIQLTNDEKAFVNEVYSKETAEIIISGGRMVLKNELTMNFNEIVTKHVLYNRISNDLKEFESLNDEEIHFLRTNFSDLFENELIKDFVLGLGRKVYDSYKRLYEENVKIQKVVEKNIYDLSRDFTIRSESKQKEEKDKEGKEKKDYVVYTKEVRQVLSEIKLDEKSILEDILLNTSFKTQIEKYNHKQKPDSPYKGIDISLMNVSIIKGLSSNKKNNLTKDFYQYNDQLEGYGFRVFKINDQNLIDYKAINEKEFISNSNIENSDFRIVLRATISFKKENDESHFAVLDNELILPYNTLVLYNVSHPDVFSYYSYDSNAWEMKDVDNSCHQNLNLIESYSEKILNDLLYNKNYLNYYIDENIIRVNGMYYSLAENQKLELSQSQNQVQVQSHAQIKVDEEKQKEKMKGKDKGKGKKEEEKEKKAKVVEINITNNYEVRYILNNEKERIIEELSEKTKFYIKEKEESLKQYKDLKHKCERQVHAMRLSCILNKSYKEIENDLKLIESKSKEMLTLSLNQTQTESKRKEIEETIKSKLKDLSPFRKGNIDLTNEKQISKKENEKESIEKEVKSEAFYWFFNNLTHVHPSLQVTDNYLDAYFYLNCEKGEELNKDEMERFFPKRWVELRRNNHLSKNSDEDYKIFDEMNKLEEEIRYMDFIDNVGIQNKIILKKTKTLKFNTNIKKYIIPKEIDF